MKVRIVVGTVILAIGAIVAGALEPRPSEGDPIPKGVSADKTYGYSETNPVRVGRLHGGPRDSEIFLSSLRGPEGQPIKFKRLGSCCFFKTPNAWVGDEAPLDQYELSYKGLKAPITLYIDVYDYEQPSAPVGLTVSK